MAIKGQIFFTPFASPEKKPPDGDSEHSSGVFGLSGEWEDQYTTFIFLIQLLKK